MSDRTIAEGSSSDGYMETNRALDHLDNSRRFDMREQVAQRAVATALAGMCLPPERIEIIARDVLVWLDDYDADATQRAYATGFRQGVAFERFRLSRPATD